jgi:putative tricarboxylic transport membrane protein
MGKSVVKGLIAAVVGLILSLIGQDPATGVDRFTFGQLWLLDGIEFVVLAMGLFGISEILINAEQNMDIPKPPKVKGLIPPRAEWGPSAKAIGRGTLVGGILGLIPGASASVASLLSYSLEKRVAKDPSRFGMGAIEGVAGPETANNAFAGAAMIPLLTLGIPSSPTVAVLIGALTMHGLMPGPLLYVKNASFLWALIASMFIGNVVLLIMNLPMANLWAKVARVPYKLLAPLILLICMVGVYSVNRSINEIGLLVLFGAVGYLMKKLEMPSAALLLAFILGNNIEYTLVQTISMSKSGLWYLFQRPISGVMMSLCIILLLGSILSSVLKKRDALVTDQDV